MLSFIIGCSSGNSNNAAEEGSSQPSATTKDDVTTIKFMSWWSYVDQSIVDEFEAKNPDVKVEMEFVPVNGYSDKIKALSASNDLPDVFGVQGADFTSLVKQERIAQLDEYLGEPAYDQDMPWRETLNSVLLDNVKDQLYLEAVDNEYGVPFGAISVAMVYNKTIFEKVGIDEPKTWDEFMSNNEKLKQAGYTPVSFVGSIGWKTWWPKLAWDQTLRGVTREDFTEGKVKFTDDRVAQGFRTVKEMWDKGYFDPASLTYDIDQTQSLFIQEKLAQYYVVPENYLGYLVKNKKAEVELGAYVLPAMYGSEPSRTIGGAPNIVVVKEGDKKDAAVRFAKYLTSNTAFGQLSKENVIPSTVNFDFADDGQTGLMEAYVQATENGFAPEIVPFNASAEFNNFLFNKVYPAILLGEMSIEEGLEQVQIEYEKTLVKQ